MKSPGSTPPRVYTQREVLAQRARIAMDKIRQVALAIETNRPEYDKVAVLFAAEVGADLGKIVETIRGWEAGQ